MEIKEIKNLKTEVVTDIICDCCGQSCKVLERVIDNELRIDNGELIRYFEYMKLEGIWGYNSNKDEEKWTAYLCEKCVDEKLPFINFKKEHVNYVL
jgi:hypothetical protein